MHIHIENYRNIDNLEYDIVDGKINYLFGVCGSGKSSIISALTKDAEPKDVSVGKNASDTVVAINGQDGIAEGVRVYNSSEQETIFRRESSTGIYEIFIGDTQELGKLEIQFNDAVSDLRSFNERVYSYQGKIQELQSALGKPSKGKFTGGAKVSKAAKVAKSKTPFLESAIQKGGLEYASWLSSGMSITDDFSNSTCPFCGKPMLEGETDKFQILTDMKVSDLKPLFSSTTLLDEFGINQKDLETNQGEEDVKKKLLLLYSVSEQLREITKFCNIPQTSLMEKGIPELNVDECVYEVFPELKSPIQTLLNKSEEIKTLLGNMKNTFNGLIRNNCQKLNRQLQRLSIPYKFRVTAATRGNNTASYELTHIKSDTGSDMRECLSTGEKNLVSLLLFLSNPDGEILMVDDPASSFDDYRRTQIFDLIQQVKDKTMLVVSHDQAFVKRAILDKQKRANIGKVQAMSHGKEGFLFTDIEKQDVVYLPLEIKRRLEESPSYWAKAINLRLLCDFNKDALGDLAWGYSSAILHRTDKSKILEELSERNGSEEGVLDKIQSVLGIEMPPLPDNYTNEIRQADLTDFERLVELRECMDDSESEESKLHKKMLNDLVHMNDAVAYCLNPYKFQLWSPNLELLLS